MTNKNKTIQKMVKTFKIYFFFQKALNSYFLKKKLSKIQIEETLNRINEV